jgi:signal transduction histidine kinase
MNERLQKHMGKHVRRTADSDSDNARGVGFFQGLSGKLLVLTIIFVMLAEVLIFVPSIANFRNVWLRNHLDIAEAASIVYLDSSDPMLSDTAQRDLLEVTGSLAVVIRAGAMSQMMASTNMPPAIDRHYDLSEMHPVESMVSALSLLLSAGDEVYRVFGPMKSRNAMIELVQRDNHLRQALRIYSRNVLLLSLAISLITAALVILALYLMIIRPVRRISNNMTAFSHEPDNAALILSPTGRRDEIGIAEQRLAAFETDLHNTLRQRQHLADLGMAVSKINHDLRNILASVQLFSDRISRLPDPSVQSLAPRLLRSIDRAIEYTRSVIAYGKAVESPPTRRPHSLRQIVEDVAELLGLDQHGRIEWRNEIAPELEVVADAEQLLRVILNICRNAVQAIENDTASPESAIKRITVSAAIENHWVLLRIADTGPGINEADQAQLFRAFGGSTKAGGTGLGLAIAAELVRAHGGDITLEESSPAGTVFLVTFPHTDPQQGDEEQQGSGKAGNDQSQD